MYLANQPNQNCIDATTMNMAKSNSLIINLRFLYCRDLVSYIYVLYVTLFNIPYTFKHPRFCHAAQRYF